MKVWVLTVESTNRKDFDTHTFTKAVYASFDGAWNELRAIASRYNSKLEVDNDKISTHMYLDNKGSILQDDNNSDWSVYKVIRAIPFELEP